MWRSRCIDFEAGRAGVARLPICPARLLSPRLAALDAAFHFGQPEICNSDQGSQFTAADFLAPLKKRGVAISMDGRGRALDNVFIERLWRTLKYELIYPGDFASGAELYPALDRYFRFYDYRRPHQALDYRTPADLYPRGSKRKGRCCDGGLCRRVGRRRAAMSHVSCTPSSNRTCGFPASGSPIIFFRRLAPQAFHLVGLTMLKRRSLLLRPADSPRLPADR